MRGLMSVAVVVSTLLFASVTTTRAELPPGCVEDESMPEAQFNELHDKLKAQSCKFPTYMRLYDLEQYIASDSMGGHGFSTNQTVALGSLFDDGGTLAEQLILDGALTALGPVTLGLACEDGTQLLELSSSQNTRIDILKAIVNVTLDLEDHSELYVDEFSNFLYKEEAKKIISEATPYGCAFGNTSVVKRLAFVIDTSGSMSTTFPGPGGKAVSRMSFVKEQLESQIRNHLASDQEFNIIHFDTQASAWNPSVQPVTEANIEKAVKYAEGLTPNGSTNMIGGLQLAMKDPKVEGIFLLTDGAPNGSKQTIIDAVKAWSNGKKPVYPTAFMAGTQGDWMQALADATGGVFRKINS